MSRLAETFERFATDFCRGYSPIYELLCGRIAHDPQLLALAAESRRGQPAPNMLLGAVHDLLLSGIQDPLASYYPSIGGQRSPDEKAWQSFQRFCTDHSEAIGERLRTRRVQTNEVRRCTSLLPSLHYVWELASREPLHLIEIGPSAGLNLRFDRYAYRYRGNGNEIALGTSELTLECALRGTGRPDLPDFPDVSSRIGIDLHPIDVRDTEATRWLKALIWPNLLDRFERLSHALELAGKDPPPLIEGDALELLPEVLSALDDTGHPCVFHSFVSCQFTRSQHRQLQTVLREYARQRPLAYVTIEQHADQDWPQIRVHQVGADKWDTHHLGQAHFHGEWLEWRSP